ncbi:MAG: ABC transporter ATP-binding protein [Thermodesulfovibrionales bacterium]|nr:ABC transporter ATP-binding protein [Thermodesulfovibrionales bacterium]
MLPVIALEGVEKIYRRGSEEIHALKDVNITFQEGEFISIVGQSGSGKTTLLNIMGCLDRPTRGTVKIDGIEVSTMNEKEISRIRREKIGFIFQQFYLIPGLTAAENVALPLKFSRKPIDKKYILSLLDTVGLDMRAKHTPDQLSGGEMQRVAIARAIANHPHVILADEPTGTLDTKNSMIIFELLKSLNSRGLTIILVTHNVAFAEKTGRVISISDGQMNSTRLDSKHITGSI